jgi:hypothetical protein
MSFQIKVRRIIRGNASFLPCLASKKRINHNYCNGYAITGIFG